MDEKQLANRGVAHGRGQVKSLGRHSWEPRIYPPINMDRRVREDNFPFERGPRR